MRGFLDDQFSTNQLYFFNTEYGLRTSDSAFYLFRDAIASFASECWMFRGSFGVGLHLYTKIGKTRVDFALPDGSSIKNGMIHLRFGD